MSFSDQQFRSTVDAIFNRFDLDKSGQLEVAEVTKLINTALSQLNQNKQTTQEEVQKFIKMHDKNGDGKIGKTELYEIAKGIVKTL